MCAAQVNALARNVVEELPDLLSALEADPEVKAIVFVSAKKDFIVGADINMFKELAAAGREGVREMVKSSHPVFDMMASGKPKIAAINGSCLGGGAEFALACHYRIAATSASLGFPEVMRASTCSGSGRAGGCMEWACWWAHSRLCAAAMVCVIYAGRRVSVKCRGRGCAHAQALWRTRAGLQAATCMRESKVQGASG